MRVLLFGSRGYIGGHFLKVYPDALCPHIDIADGHAVAEVLDREKPDVVINAAGKTGKPNVDWCEEHKLETVHGNITGPLVLFEELLKRGIYGVHLSSACIYEGDNGGRGFAEDDPPNFFGSFYARTKIWSDRILAELTAAHRGEGGILLLRLRMPFEGPPNDRNLITKLLKYPKVLDAENSLTYIPDFFDTAKILIDRRRTGVYHIVNPGTISPFTIVKRYSELVDSSHKVERITLESLPDVVKAGRSNCVLSTKKLQEEGIALTDVSKRVDEALGILQSQ